MSPQAMWAHRSIEFKTSCAEQSDRINKRSEALGAVRRFCFEAHVQKIKNVVSPSLLFAAGAIAGNAQANVIHTYDVDYTAVVGGTPITIGDSASNQYNFVNNADSGKSYLNANGVATLSSTVSASPLYPDESSATATSVKVSGYSSQGPGYYGLRFSDNTGAQTGYAFIDSGLHITQISYQAASTGPEPDTWALMIVGVGGLGFALRQQRRRQRKLNQAIA